jgi:membrane protein YdbS with pleckstrin-like domain
LSPQGLEIRRGVWWRHQIVVSKSRIQHSDIEQGPLQRSHGIGTLVVHTAGTKNSSVQIDGLALETATQLRDALVSKRLASGDLVASGIGGDADGV